MGTVQPGKAQPPSRTATASRSGGGASRWARPTSTIIDPPSRTTGITSAEHARRRSSPGDTEVPSIKTPRAVVRSSSSAYGTTTMSCAAPEGTRTSLRPPPEPEGVSTASAVLTTVTSASARRCCGVSESAARLLRPLFRGVRELRRHPVDQPLRHRPELLRRGVGGDGEDQVLRLPPLGGVQAGRERVQRLVDRRRLTQADLPARRRITHPRPLLQLPSPPDRADRLPRGILPGPSQPVLQRRVPGPHCRPRFVRLTDQHGLQSAHPTFGLDELLDPGESVSVRGGRPIRHAHRLQSSEHPVQLGTPSRWICLWDRRK